VLTEWEHVTRMYLWSARRLNSVTKQIDIDVYDHEDNLVDVSDFKIDIEFLIPRMKWKNPEAVDFGRK